MSSITTSFSCNCSEENLCVVCVKSQAAQARFDELQARLVKAAEEVHALRVAQNEAHDPLFRLPLEITSKIFEEYHEGHRAEGLWDITWSPITLGAVCRFWRRIAWSTPKLWTAIQYRLCPHNECEERFKMLEDYIRRSGVLLLSIHFSCWYDDGMFGDADLMPVIGILKLCISRTMSLYLQLPIDTLRSLPRILGSNPSPNLRRLHLLAQDHAECVFLDDRRPFDWSSMTTNLEELVLEKGDDMMWLGSLKVAHTRLRHIEGPGSAAAWLRCLQNSPRLRAAVATLDWEDLNEGEEIPSDMPNHVYTHPVLQHLHIICEPGGLLHSFVQRISCPNLEFFRLDVSRQYRSPVLQTGNPLRDFLLSSGKQLRRLELNRFAFSSNDLREAFAQLPVLQTLSIANLPSPTTSQILEAIFGDIPDNGRTTTFLPNLQKVDLNGTQWGLDDNWDFLHMIVSHVKSVYTYNQDATTILSEGGSSSLSNLRSVKMLLEVDQSVYDSEKDDEKTLLLNGSDLSSIREVQAYGVDFQASFFHHDYVDIVKSSEGFWKNSTLT